MTGRFTSWMFAAALAVVSIGCQPAEEPVTDTTVDGVDVDLGEAQPTGPAADSNTTTTTIETPDVAETPEPESTGLELPAETTDEPVVVEEPAQELPAETKEE